MSEDFSVTVLVKLGHKAALGHKTGHVICLALETAGLSAGASGDGGGLPWLGGGCVYALDRVDHTWSYKEVMYEHVSGR